MIVDFLVQLLNWVTIQLQLLFTQFVRKISLCEQTFMGEKAAIRIKFAVLVQHLFYCEWMIAQSPIPIHLLINNPFKP